MKKYSAAFSLIELIMVIAILGILSATASYTIARGMNAYFTEQKLADSTWQARLALERMQRDIQAIRSPAGITTAAATQLVFTDFDGNSVTYAYDSINKLITRNSQTLANNISALTFSYRDRTAAVTATTANIRYITAAISITNDDLTYTTRSTFYPRNLLP